MNNFPFVSIIIPCRNEEKYIAKCLDSIISQDFPKDKLEILVVNGASEDKTKEIVAEYSQKYPYIKLLENPKKFTPFGLNIGVKTAKGEIIVRMDAHAGYQQDYIPKCVQYLEKTGADNVGGVIKTLPSNNTNEAKAIALCLSHFFGAGNSHFRTGSKEVREVDTVFGGCYKKEVFSRIGLFNEKLRRSQDIEFNKRLRKAGGKILLVPEIVAFYYPQSNLKDFFKHNFNDGVWTIYPIKFGVRIFSWRHLVPLFFVLSLILALILSPSLSWWVYFLYILIADYFSFQIAKKEKNYKLFWWIGLAFSCRHFGYGLGSLWGFVKICKD